MDLRTRIGMRLFSGFPGKEMSEDFKRMVREYKLGNVILFSNNIESLEQLNRLCIEIDEFITAETGYHPLISIDQEGGMVSRLPDSSVVAPSQMAESALEDPDVVEECAYRNGRLLMELGCNFNLAPVLDINVSLKNPVIGVRSFSDRSEKVTEYGVRAVRGYNRSGILSSAKHFPGHGNTGTDSHLALPVIDLELAELEDQLKPFVAAIEEGVPAVTTSHILFPKIESEVPCTMSRKLITGLLREKLGFKGIVISDCMQMQAISRFYGSVNGAVRAFEAGVDMVFFSHDVNLVEEFVKEYERLAAEGGIDKECFDACSERVLAVKEKLSPVTKPESFDFSQTKNFFDETATAAVTEVIPLDAGFDPKKAIFIGPEAFITSKISDRIERAAFPSYMAKEFLTKAIITTADPSQAQTENVLKESEGYEYAVVGTYNAHLQKGQEALIRALSRDHKVILFALRNPYDMREENLSYVKGAFATYEYSERIFAECARILKGEGKLKGHLPVYVG